MQQKFPEVGDDKNQMMTSNDYDPAMILTRKRREKETHLYIYIYIL